MHLFGLLGTLMFVVGTVSAAYIGVNKLVLLSEGIKVSLVTRNPWFYISLTSMVIGVQLFMTGFLAELIIRHSGRPMEYTVAEKIGGA